MVHLLFVCILLYLANAFSETAPVTTVLKCSSTVGTECCPAACTERRLNSIAAARECTDAIPSRCTITMTATADFYQTPCMVPIQETRSSGGKILPGSYSTWVKFPDGIFNTLLPWTKGRLDASDTTTGRSHGCRVVFAGLGMYPQDQSCAPLAEDNLYPMPMLNYTLGAFDGLLAMGGAYDAINVIYEVWTVGKTNNIAYIDSRDKDGNGRHKKFGGIEWSPRCDDLGNLNYIIEVTGSAPGRSDIEKSSYNSTPFTLKHEDA